MDRRDPREAVSMTQGMFLSVADAVASGSHAVVITPAPLPVVVPLLPQQDSRDELWRDVQSDVRETRRQLKRKPIQEAVVWPRLGNPTVQKSRFDTNRILSKGVDNSHVAAARRVYEASMGGKKSEPRRLRSPPTLQALDPLDRMKKQQHRMERQQKDLIKSVENRIDTMSRAIPIEFLLEHENRRVFAERVLLLAMCRILRAHYDRVMRVAWSVWKKRTLTLRILEEQERKLFLLRQTSLAHACAIVQRRIYAKLRTMLCRWKSTTDMLRWYEQMRCAWRIQKCWRAWWMQRKLKTLALLYRSRVRHDSAVCIQSAIRRFLACRDLKRLVWANKRHVAAVLIQHAYRNYVAVQIAKRHRQEVAAVTIQRTWRGRIGRQVAQHRRNTCRTVVIEVVEQSWQWLGIANAIYKHSCAIKIQRLRRVYLYRRQINSGICRSHKRRHYFPTTRIQRAWFSYRLYCIQLVAEGVVFRVVITHVGAARRIQNCFRKYWKAKVTFAACTLTRLFRLFAARRELIGSRLIPFLQDWERCHFRKWKIACGERNETRWWQSLTAGQDNISRFSDNQRSPLRRLNAHAGIRLLRELKQFEKTFSAARARQIQLVWRLHRLRVLIAQLRDATVLLHRAIPSLYRQFKRRRQRHRVLQRWRRLRYMDLHTRFETWKHQYLLRIQARYLATTTRNVRKALWFRHHKLRQLIVQRWKAFILDRRDKRTKINIARLHANGTLMKVVWCAWRNESLPFMCCGNRLHEMAMVLTVWKTWIMFVKRKQRSRSAREHYKHWLIEVALAGWRLDNIDFLSELEMADRYSTHHSKKERLIRLAQYAAKEKRVRGFCRSNLQAYGLRNWLETIYTVKRDRSNRIAASTFREHHLRRSSWMQWVRYWRHQLLQNEKRRAMASHYERRCLQRAISDWSQEFVPVRRDYHFILEVATVYRSRRLKECCFRQGIRMFWEVTAGARRIAMATRIQRMFRSKRARTRIAIMRLKIKFQLEMRATMGVDTRKLTSANLHDTFSSCEWTFVLFSLPWAPIPPRTKEAFCKTATTWSFLRKQAHRMVFGIMDATELISLPTHSFSLMTWFGLQPDQLPCVVGFWHGVGPSPSSTDQVCRLANGEELQLKRRFKTICGAVSTSPCFLVHPMVLKELESSCQHVPMSHFVRWIERLQDAAHDATAIDLQAYIRGFLVRRRTKRFRIIRRELCKQLIRRYCDILISRWTNTKQQRAATIMQIWVRHVQARRKFWLLFWREVDVWKRATQRIQHSARAYLDLLRRRRALLSLLATPQRYQNAPLCQLCLSQSEALACLRCRDCEQALCTDCFTKTHRSGKRLLHVCDNIDFVAFNDPSSHMCNACEVRRSTRFCSSCESLGSCMEFCTSCFEAKHTDMMNGGNVEANRVQQIHRSWWQSQAFREHKWKRCDATVQLLGNSTITASSVMGKYSWQNKSMVTLKQLEAAKAEDSVRDREARLLAIRVQQEAILRDAFERYDTDQSGAIDRNEFKRMFKEELCEPLSDEQVDEAMKCMDKSGNGLVEFDELLAWFAEDALTKQESGASQQPDPRSLAMLKDALRAKRQMRRYKEKLNEFVPSLSMQVPKPYALTAAISQLTERKQKKQTVPGFPSVDCIEHADFARKRKVFYRFLKEICNLDWIYEDESSIPILNVMDVFDKVFVPRWNTGELTYDFYFDDESFEFEGEIWERKWMPETKKYVFTTTRRKMRQINHISDHSGHKRHKRFGKRTAGVVEHVQVEETVEIVEYVDPRRKQMLMEEAQEAFKKADSDGSGFIDEREFHRMLTLELCEPVSKTKVIQIMKQLDADGSGKIDFHEFFQWYAAEKCQEYPMTPQMARARALLQTRRRAKATAAAAVHAGVSSGIQLKEAFARRRKEQQLAKDCKGASPELIQLLQEGFSKPLAEKALTLHNQDAAFARKWLHDHQEQEQLERDEAIKARADKRARAKKVGREKKQKRQQRMTALRKQLKLLVIGPSKKEAHAARLQQALSNLDREIQLVEFQMTQ